MELINMADAIRCCHMLCQDGLSSLFLYCCISDIQNIAAILCYIRMILMINNFGKLFQIIKI